LESAVLQQSGKLHALLISKLKHSSAALVDVWRPITKVLGTPKSLLQIVRHGYVFESS
jgi:hypothetical protein